MAENTFDNYTHQMNAFILYNDVVYEQYSVNGLLYPNTFKTHWRCQLTMKYDIDTWIMNQNRNWFLFISRSFYSCAILGSVQSRLTEAVKFLLIITSVLRDWDIVLTWPMSKHKARDEITSSKSQDKSGTETEIGRPPTLIHQFCLKQ